MPFPRGKLQNVCSEVGNSTQRKKKINLPSLFVVQLQHGLSTAMLQKKLHYTRKNGLCGLS